MKKYFVVMPILLVSFLFSCNKINFQPYHKRIVGIWEFEEVFYRPGAFKSRKDITNEFAHLQLQFFDNGTFEQVNTNTSTVEIGYWNMWEDAQYNNTVESSTTVYWLEMNYRSLNGELIVFVWQVDNITAKRMRAREEIQPETYTYKLKRLD